MNPDLRALADELADAVASDDSRRIAEIVGGNLWALVQSSWPLLAEALERLPPEFLQSHPQVDLVKRFGASVFLEGGGVNHRALAVFESPEGAAVPDEFFDAILLQEMLAHRLRGDLAGARRVATRLRERIERSGPDGRRPIHGMVGFYLLQVGITEALCDNLEQALDDFANARALRSKSGDGLAEYDAALKAAAVQAVLGRLIEAETLLEQAGPLPSVGEPFATHLVGTEIAARALIAVDRLSPEAPELVRRAIELNADTEMIPVALLASIRWSVANGDLVGALDQVDHAAARAAAAPDSAISRVVTTMRAHVLALMGEVGAAFEVLEADLAGDGAVQATSAVRVRLALYTDGPDAALRAARKLMVRRGIGPSVRAHVMLLAAWAQTLLLGAPDGATAGPLGALVAREGLWRVLQLAPEHVVAQIPGLGDAPDFERRLTHWEGPQGHELTANELEVLRLLVTGESLAAIARRRFVSPNTVKTQVASIYRRLGVHGRREAVAEATRRGILKPFDL